jgi:hypothetical protein
MSQDQVLPVLVLGLLLSCFDDNPAGKLSRSEKGISERQKLRPWHRTQSPISSFSLPAQSSTEGHGRKWGEGLQLYVASKADGKMI